MNENIDLTKIFKDCPEGWEFWSDDYGKVQFLRINRSIEHPIIVRRTDGSPAFYTKEGWRNIDFPANCLLWPSREMRDWSKFTAPWYKNNKFDPNTLKPFDKVLVRDDNKDRWFCDFFSHNLGAKIFRYICISGGYKQCIPYNDDTKHLVGTTDKAPEYYRYWEECV